VLKPNKLSTSMNRQINLSLITKRDSVIVLINHISTFILYRQNCVFFNTHFPDVLPDK